MSWRRAASWLAIGRRSRAVCYAVAVAAVVVLTLLKMRFAVLGESAPVATYLGVVMFAAWFGGAGPGLLATGLSCLAGAYFFPPLYAFAIASDDDAAHLAVTAAEGVVISVLGGVLRRKDVDLARRTEQLHHAEKMQAFGVFAGGVAHDFNNMLGVVLTCAEILERRLPEDHPARNEIAEIREAAARAAGLTRQLLTFARRREVERHPLDLHEALVRIEPIVRRIVGPFVKVKLVLAATRSRVLADGPQLELAIVNLAANARDAMPDGGELTICTADAADARRVELAVRDSGVGMSASTKARVFEPFFTTKGAGKGTGLGLSMVFGIVEAMEGAIAIESELGRGSTFRISFPLVA